MITFRGTRLNELRLPVRTVRWMMEITEAKGHQQLQARLAGQLLRALRMAAFVRNVESSCRMEGVTVGTGRLLPLLAGHVKPNDQFENEIYGYSRALNAIYESDTIFTMTTASLLTIQVTILAGSPGAGEWRTPEMKSNDTHIEHPDVLKVASGGEIPVCLQELCRSYAEALNDPNIHSLLAIASFLLDFQCVRPFGRGQTRMDHLITLGCLHQSGFEVAKYISLGRWFERTREEWASAVRQSSAGWEVGKHDPLPWLEYFVGVLHRAYEELEQTTGKVKNPRGAKTVLVESAIDGFPDPFTMVELEQVCPGVSRIVIHRVLRELLEAQRIVRLRRGVYAARQGASQNGTH